MMTSVSMHAGEMSRKQAFDVEVIQMISQAAGRGRSFRRD